MMAMAFLHVLLYVFAIYTLWFINYRDLKLIVQNVEYTDDFATANLSYNMQE